MLPPYVDPLILITHSYLQVDHEDSSSSDSESLSSDEANADVASRVVNSNESNGPELQIVDIWTLQSLMKKIGDILCTNPSARPESMIEMVSPFYPQTELEHNDIRQNLVKLTKMAETRDCAVTLIPILPSSGE